MKKKFLLTILLSLGLTVSLGACSGGNTPDPTPDPTVEPTPTEEEWPEENKTQVYNFYLDYNNVDTPFYTLEWWPYRPLGECPKEAIPTAEDCFDELFPVFLGYSQYPSSIDDSKLWNFATDYKVNRIVNLYGIWVAKD